MKFINTAADIPLVVDHPLYDSSQSVTRIAAEKVRRLTFQVLYCHECVAGPEWSSGDRAGSDYLHHVNLVTSGSAECFLGTEKLRLRPGQAYFFPGNTPLRRVCRRRFESYLIVFRCEWFAGIDLLLDWPDRRPLCLGDFDERAWRKQFGLGATNAMLHVQSLLGLWLAAVCPDLNAVITRHIDCHSRFSRVFEHVERNLDARLRVGRLARVFGASIHAFSLAFSRAVGLSPKAFIDRQLNERIIQDLIASDQSLEAIAARWGFADQFQLSRYFKRLNGSSPSSFRRGFFAGSRQPFGDAPGAR